MKQDFIIYANYYNCNSNVNKNIGLRDQESLMANSSESSDFNTPADNSASYYSHNNSSSSNINSFASSNNSVYLDEDKGSDTDRAKELDSDMATPEEYYSIYPPSSSKNVAYI